MTPLEAIHEAIGWDDRKTVADVYQDAGGRLTDLSDETYDALLAVARWGADALLQTHDLDVP